MEKNVIEAKNIVKKYKNFTLDVPELKLPEGFATALIGENGAGKTTLLNILTGIRMDYTGDITYFGEYSDKDIFKNPAVKERIGYTGTDNYYLPHWTMKQVDDLSQLLFEKYDSAKFKRYCDDLAVFGGKQFDGSKKISALSDGTKTKIMLAGVLARETDILIMDEPASPLDPLMRDKLCEMIREYLNSGEGKSVFFSTHNISDMEGVTDYAVTPNGREALFIAEGGVYYCKLVAPSKVKQFEIDAKAVAIDRSGMYEYTGPANGWQGVTRSGKLFELYEDAE